MILAVSFFFRTYQIVERFDFGHDGDLSAWIVKDIAVNHHFRLIGQLTTAPGIFIGPIYYYLLIPFYFLTNMDPVGGVVLITILGILTTLSYYLVFGKLFNQKLGLIAAFLEATLLSLINLDRWVVPSTPSNLWVIWYFYTIAAVSQGNFSVLPLLGILIGLIWNIHIALAPCLVAVPVAFIVSKKLPKLKQVLLGIAALLVTSIPLILFEMRHNFSQTASLIQGFAVDHGGEKGLPKLVLVLQMLSKNINALFLAPQSLPQAISYIFTLSLLLIGVLLILKKILPGKIALSLFAWIIGVVGFFTFSSSLVSEYYLYSVDIIFITIVSLSLCSLIKYSKPAGFLVLIILTAILAKNIYYFVTTDIYHKGYIEKKAIAKFITNDSKLKGFPCVGISYITTPGENVGFRYFFYLDNLHLVHPSLDIPVYNIVIPDELSKDEIDKKFGHIGVITPKNIPSEEVINKSCQTPNTNLTDSMFGYVQ